MSDNPRDPRNNPPSRLSTGLGKTTAVLEILSGTANVLIGAVILPRAATKASASLGDSNKVLNKIVMPLNIYLVVDGIFKLVNGGLAFKHADFADKVRVANHVDELKLQELQLQSDIKKEQQKL